MAEPLFGLSGDEYWSNPWKNGDELIERYVYGREFGIYVDAPPEVDPSAHETIPLLILYVSMERDLAQIDFSSMAKLVVSDVRARSLSVASAVAPGDTGRPGRPFDPKSNAATSQTYETDLVVQGGLRQPGDYLAVALLWDKLSNPVRVKVGRRASAYSDPEVEKFLEARRKALFPYPPPPALPAPGQAFPSYQQVEGSPEIPAQPGLAASIERVVLSAAGAHCVLSGSFRLPVYPEDRVPPAPPALPEGQAATPGKNDETPPPEYGTPRPTAVVPIHVVMTASIEVTQRVMSLRVPTWDALPEGPEPAFATGYFNLDLFADPAVAAAPQTHFIYLFSGEHLSGPHVMAVVTDEMLQVPGR